MFKILKQETRTATCWSGGTTQELYIYPEYARYEKRDFKFRISIASTETDCSHFTPFPHACRVISVLDGTLKIQHKNRYSIILQHYDIDRFSGDWETTAYGKVTDFNLIVQKGTGDFFYKEICNVHDIFFSSEHKSRNFIFCIAGPLVINGSELQSGELAITDKSKLEVKSNNGKFFYGYAAI